MSTSTWEPDWDALAGVPFEGGWCEACHIAVAEYRRQQAAAGFVEVRRADVQGAMAVLVGVAASDQTNAESAYRLLTDLHAALSPEVADGS